MAAETEVVSRLGTQMPDLKTIGAIIGITTGSLALVGMIGNYFVNTTHQQDAIVALAKRADDHDVKFTEQRNELNGMHQRENTLGEGLVNAHNEIALAQSDISGKLGVMSANLQHVRETLDEVRNVQHKFPASLSGTTSQ
ncbi:MAG: hypothetical protein ACLQNV_05535 [Steroidobacteraceae bacterium]